MAWQDEKKNLHDDHNNRFVEKNGSESTGAGKTDEEKLDEARQIYDTATGSSETDTHQKTYSVEKDEQGRRIISVGTRVDFGNKKLKFNAPIILTDMITICDPENFRGQNRLAKNTGIGYGKWCKRGANAEIEVSGMRKNVQIHWYEVPGSKTTGYKVCDKKKEGGRR